MCKKVVAFVFLALLSGCATPSNEVSMKVYGAKDRLYVGRINVNFNGNTKPTCEIYLNHDISPSIRLSEDGVVLYKTDRSQLRFRSIACLDKATARVTAWHHQSLNLNGIAKSESNDVISYFGDINVRWKIDRSETISSTTHIVDSTAYVKEGQVKDSGEIRVEISNQKGDLEKFVESQIPEYKSRNFSLVDAIVTKNTN